MEFVLTQLHSFVHRLQTKGPVSERSPPCADFQLELLLQALRFSRASAKEGRATKSLAKVVVGSMFLRWALFRLFINGISREELSHWPSRKRFWHSLILSVEASVLSR